MDHGVNTASIYMYRVVFKKESSVDYLAEYKTVVYHCHSGLEGLGASLCDPGSAQTGRVPGGLSYVLLPRDVSFFRGR